MANKRIMATQTILINKEAWDEEINKICEKRRCSKQDLCAEIAPHKNRGYLSSIHLDNPRVDIDVFRAIGKLGADLNAIIAINEEPEAPKEKDEQAKNSLEQIEKRLERLNDQIGTVIEALYEMINIWRGTDHAEND